MGKYKTGFREWQSPEALFLEKCGFEPFKFRQKIGMFTT